MATTAAVHFEANNKTIFVGMDGYPSHMLPTLSDFQERGILELVTENSDYMCLSTSYSEATAKLGHPLAHGVLYREQQQALTVEHDPFTNAPLFYDGHRVANPDYKYSVRASGEIVAHQRY